MIQIATPMSHLFKDQATGERIARASDCLECREWCLTSEWPGQKLFHFDLNINMPWGEREKREIALAAKPGMRLMTFQMASCYERPVVENRAFVPGGRRVPREEMLANVAENVRWLRSALPASLVFGIENNNYYPTPAYEDVCDGSFISQAVRDNGLRFLLDIAHAQVTAVNRNVSYEAYLSELPMERLIQLHICQPALDEKTGTAYDAHELPDLDMENEVRRLCELHDVEYLTVEYYKDAERLIGCLERFSKMREGVHR